MLKSLEDPIKKTRCESICDFVHMFDLEKEFEKEFGVDIHNWNNDQDDQSCMEILLEKKKGVYRCVYVDDRNCGHFIIEEYEERRKA